MGSLSIRGRTSTDVESGGPLPLTLEACRSEWPQITQIVADRH